MPPSTLSFPFPLYTVIDALSVEGEWEVIIRREPLL